MTKYRDCIGPSEGKAKGDPGGKSPKKDSPKKGKKRKSDEISSDEEDEEEGMDSVEYEEKLKQQNEEMWNVRDQLSKICTKQNLKDLLEHNNQVCSQDVIHVKVL